MLLTINQLGTECWSDKTSIILYCLATQIYRVFNIRRGITLALALNYPRPDRFNKHVLSVIL
jgi:hypothetical protein